MDFKPNFNVTQDKIFIGANIGEVDKSFIDVNMGEVQEAIKVERGATFYPSVSKDGMISWTNDRELENPLPVNIKGDTGASGENGIGIKSVVQTTTSTASGGENIITVTLTDGAKSSFEVRNGAKGADGVNGKNGTNGIPATHSWSGTILTIKSASGTSSANLKGEKGADGYTPIKGTDYFTEADKADFLQSVISSLPIYDGEAVDE